MRQVVFATLDPAFAKLKTVLKLFDYDGEAIYFTCIRDVYLPVVEEVISDLKLQVLLHNITSMKYVPKDLLKWLDVA